MIAVIRNRRSQVVLRSRQGQLAIVILLPQKVTGVFAGPGIGRPRGSPEVPGKELPMILRPECPRNGHRGRQEARKDNYVMELTDWVKVAGCEQ